MNEGPWTFPSRGGIMLRYMPLGQLDYAYVPYDP
jgi:hypothetical protein